jgi:hypothetical protein
MQNLHHENYLFLTRHQWLHLFQSPERTIDRGGFGQQEKGLQISLKAQFLHCLSNLIFKCSLYCMFRAGEFLPSVLKVPKCEIFNFFDFNDLYVIKCQ